MVQLSNRRHTSRRRRPPGFTESVREFLIKRIEDATEDGTLEVDSTQLASLLWVLFPEDYREPPAGKPTDTPPSSTLRVEEYARRASHGKRLFSEGDAPGDDPNRGMIANWFNGRGAHSTGWDTDDN